MAILSGMVGWVSTAFSLPNATCPIHLWGEKNTPLGVITLGPRQAHWMRPWLTLVTRLRPSALPYRRIRALLLLLTATALSASEATPLPSAEEVVTKMLAQDAQRRTLIDGYRGMRRYVLQNTRMHKNAEMLVRVECDADGTKHFEVVDEEGWKAAHKHVLHKMLESEAEASHPQVLIKTRLSTDNYEFH